jgi:hypothetical protein
VVWRGNGNYIIIISFSRIKTNGSLPRDASQRNSKSPHRNDHCIFTFTESAHCVNGNGNSTQSPVSFSSILPQNLADEEDSIGEAFSPPLFNSTAMHSHQNSSNFSNNSSSMLVGLRNTTSPYENVPGNNNNNDPTPRLGTRASSSHVNQNGSSSNNPRRPILLLPSSSCNNSNGNNNGGDRFGGGDSSSRSDSASPPKSKLSVSFANSVKEFGADEKDEDVDRLDDDRRIQVKDGKKKEVSEVAVEVEVHMESDSLPKNNNPPSICITPDTSDSTTDTKKDILIKTKCASSSSSSTSSQSVSSSQSESSASQVKVS